MSSDKLADYFAKLKKKHEYVLSVKDVERVDLHIEQYVRNLVTGESRRIFGDYDIGEKLCKSFLSLCLRNEEKNIIAVLCVDDNPNVPAIPPWEWGHWLYNLYKLEKIDPSNTLWVHCVAWNLDYTYKMLKPLLQGLFLRCWYLEYVILVAPPGFVRVDWLEEHATRIFPEGNYNPKNVQTLYLMVRQNFVKKYKIRRAVEEDNDDLVPLVHEHSERLQEIYGEYYVAELLTRHPDDGRQMIVAEEGGYAVAMLCLNDTVNYDALNDNFEMAPFYGLRKPHDDDTFGTPQASMITISPLDEVDVISTHQNDEFTPCHSVSIESFESEIELEIHSEESEDDFTIVSMTSIHMDETDMIADDDDALESKESEYSCVMLSFNEYDMHLYSDKNKIKSVSLDNFNLKKISLRDTSRGIPVYHGEHNAFTLELAVSKPEHDDALRLLLEAAFECFPERDYCVLAVPATCPPFALLDYFVRVTPRAVSSFPHEIYVLHRNAIASYLSVRQANGADLDQVEELLAKIPRAEALIIDFETAVSDPNSEHLAYVFRSEEQIVGVAVVKEVEDLDYLRTHYEVMTWLSEVRHKPGSHGLIEHFVVSTIFQRHCRFFLREVHRLSDFSALYYKVTPADTSRAHKERCLPAILGDMVLVQPRQKPEFTHTNLEECGPSDVVHRIDEPFALHLSTTRHCSLPSYQINTRIVVVGSSDTAIAFLEALLCTSDRSFQVTFTNVSVIAPHGLNYQKPPNRIRDMLFVTTNNLTHRHMNLIALGTYVNVVLGVMTAIDRKNKKVVINDNSFLPYDLLFLMCGSQYQKPKPLENDMRKKDTSMTEYPENVFIINTEIDGNNALIKLKALIAPRSKTKYKIIVYGHCLMAYCCLSALLEFGVTGEHIIFVDPFPYTREIREYHEVSIFNDSEVDDAVMQSIKDQGITVYTSYQFLEWNYTTHGNKINSVKFLSKTKLINIECIAFFIYSEKCISTRTFLAINRAGLVFDGLLVIGSDCKTNDPYIYAAGSFTKYSRRYYADDLAPKYSNQYEIGYKLGLQIRKKLIPFRDKEEKESLWNNMKCDKGDKLVPRYVQPISRYCELPGGLNYLYVVKPGKEVPLEVAMGMRDYGKVLVTGDCKTLDRQGYFRLHLNSFNAVETITCLAKFPIDRINLTSIWGKHEKLLNNLALRFELLMIPDLFEFFREPWACAIYHDRFKFLEENVNEIMCSLTSEEGQSLIEDLIGRFKKNNWSKLSNEDRREIEDKFVDSPYHRMLEKEVLDFLEDNYTYLTMYAHPYIIKMILQGYENSPLFNPE